MLTTIGTPALWTGFLVGIVALLLLDLGVFHRRPHAVRFREALAWSVFWVALSLLFNLFVYLAFGSQAGLEFFTGYVIEKALSVDNIFVFVLIFRYFAVPAELQHRVLFWGVVGAIVLRALFIGLGTVLLAKFHWVILLFGAFLVFTGYRILRHDSLEVHPEQNPMVNFFRRLVPMTAEFRGQRFFTRVNGVRFATPLMLVLVVIETSDVVFAVDSIPAIFGVTQDPFIVFTSNILAVLGLRALYFVLADVMHRFTYLSAGLGAVLIFIGLKMLLADFYHLPTAVSLGVVSAILLFSILLSFLRTEVEPDPSAPDDAPPPSANYPGES